MIRFLVFIVHLLMYSSQLEQCALLVMSYGVHPWPTSMSCCLVYVTNPSWNSVLC